MLVCLRLLSCVVFALGFLIFCDAMSALASSNATIGVGFGTAALGGNCYQVVLMALEAGFRKYDTAEADWWYDQSSVGAALKDYFIIQEAGHDNCVYENGAAGLPTCSQRRSCLTEDVRISTKIPPWSLTSEEDIRRNAKNSRQELVGFCENVPWDEANNEKVPFPLDIYYIHAPACWKGWHPRCDNPPPILNLYDSWKAMEAVVGLDKSARRIGLSNVHPQELRAIIGRVQERQQAGETNPPPRMPDALQAFADPIQPAEELRQICAEHGIEFVSYSTLGTQHRSEGLNPVLTNPIVQGLSAKHSRSVAEVVLSWALQQGMSVIPRSSNRKHIDELARLLDERNSKFLDDDDLKSIDNLKNNAS